MRSRSNHSTGAASFPPEDLHLFWHWWLSFVESLHRGPIVVELSALKWRWPTEWMFVYLIPNHYFLKSSEVTKRRSGSRVNRQISGSRCCPIRAIFEFIPAESLIAGKLQKGKWGRIGEGDKKEFPVKSTIEYNKRKRRCTKKDMWEWEFASTYTSSDDSLFF